MSLVGHNQSHTIAHLPSFRPASNGRKGTRRNSGCRSEARIVQIRTLPKGQPPIIGYRRWTRKTTLGQSTPSSGPVRLFRPSPRCSPIRAQSLSASATPWPVLFLFGEHSQERECERGFSHLLIQPVPFVGGCHSAHCATMPKRSTGCFECRKVRGRQQSDAPQPCRVVSCRFAVLIPSP